MTARETAEIVIGYVALVLWSFQLLPQAWKNFRSGSAVGLSVLMMALWAIWTPFFGGYAIYSDLAVPLLVQPNLFGFFATICFVQCIYYGTKSNREKRGPARAIYALLLLAVCLAVLGGLETGLYFATKKASESSWPNVTFALGVLPTILIVLGFVPMYYEIFKTSIVDGLSEPFLIMDTLGGILSVLALGLRPPPFDWLNAGSYAAVAILDLGILALIRWYKWTGKAKPVNSETPAMSTSQLESAFRSTESSPV
ncbi:hypothetical protein PhCBS80983_g04982 [Powellomyces hirtus]|uniref:Uncharacterized protein n=1 Tax=Powellomyces hirtus TaxID=109895 RepID=A0A507DVV1_9FUNG|nr:hypothetical protein PhCBS80983_g04982 [Powellomyces hirtus]